MRRWSDRATSFTSLARLLLLLITSTSVFTISFVRRRSLVLPLHPFGSRTTTLLTMITVCTFQLLSFCHSQCTKRLTVFRAFAMFTTLVVILGDNVAMVKQLRMMMFTSLVLSLFRVYARASALAWGLPRFATEEAKKVLPGGGPFWGDPGRLPAGDGFTP